MKSTACAAIETAAQSARFRSISAINPTSKRDCPARGPSEEIRPPRIPVVCYGTENTGENEPKWAEISCLGNYLADFQAHKWAPTPPPPVQNFLTSNSRAQPPDRVLRGEIFDRLRAGYRHERYRRTSAKPSGWFGLCNMRWAAASHKRKQLNGQITPPSVAKNVGKRSQAEVQRAGTQECGTTENRKIRSEKHSGRSNAGRHGALQIKT